MARSGLGEARKGKRQFIQSWTVACDKELLFRLRRSRRSPADLQRLEQTPEIQHYRGLSVCCKMISRANMSAMDAGIENQDASTELLTRTEAGRRTTLFHLLQTLLLLQSTLLGMNSATCDNNPVSVRSWAQEGSLPRSRRELLPHEGYPEPGHQRSCLVLSILPSDVRDKVNIQAMRPRIRIVVHFNLDERLDISSRRSNLHHSTRRSPRT